MTTANVDDLSEAAWWALDVEHERVLQARDVVMTEGELGLVSSHRPGETLRSLLKLCNFKRRAVPPGVALGIVHDVMQALRAAAEEAQPLSQGLGYVHGGLSPDHVFVDTAGHGYLLDLGVAAAARRVPSIAENPEVTGYSSPEQLQDKPTADARSDVFIAGILLWEMLSAGRRLFVGSSHTAAVDRVLRHKVPRLGASGEAVPQHVADLVARALERNPKQRFANLGEFCEALEAAQLAPRDEVGAWLQDLAQNTLESRARLVARATGQPLPTARERMGSVPDRTWSIPEPTPAPVTPAQVAQPPATPPPVSPPSAPGRAAQLEVPPPSDLFPPSVTPSAGRSLSPPKLPRQRAAESRTDASATSAKRTLLGVAPPSVPDNPKRTLLGVAPPPLPDVMDPGGMDPLDDIAPSSAEPPTVALPFGALADAALERGDEALEDRTVRMASPFQSPSPDAEQIVRALTETPSPMEASTDPDEPATVRFEPSADLIRYARARADAAVPSSAAPAAGMGSAALAASTQNPAAQSGGHMMEPAPPTGAAAGAQPAVNPTRLSLIPKAKLYRLGAALAAGGVVFGLLVGVLVASLRTPDDDEPTPAATAEAPAVPAPPEGSKTPEVKPKTQPMITTSEGEEPAADAGNDADAAADDAAPADDAAAPDAETRDAAATQAPSAPKPQPKPRRRVPKPKPRFIPSGI